MRACVVLNPNQQYDKFIYQHFGACVVKQLLEAKNVWVVANTRYFEKYKISPEVNQLNLCLMINKLIANSASNVKILHTDKTPLVYAEVDLKVATWLSYIFNQQAFIARLDDLYWRMYSSCKFGAYYMPNRKKRTKWTPEELCCYEKYLDMDVQILSCYKCTVTSEQTDLTDYIKSEEYYLRQIKYKYGRFLKYSNIIYNAEGRLQ